MLLLILIILLIILAIFVIIKKVTTIEKFNTISTSKPKQKCYGQRDVCNKGYQLKIPYEDKKKWACGSKCTGGKYWTDSSCNCACIEDSLCQ